MPPAAWISSSARSKPCFHCAPYCAFGPVNGPLTPSMIGSDDCARAPRDIAAPVTKAAREPLTRLRRLMFLICDSIRSETGNSILSGQFSCQRGPMRSRIGPLCRLAERQHQSVRPVEERRAVDHVDDLGIVETHAAQFLDVLLAECDRRRGECNRSADNGIPARA